MTASAASFRDPVHGFVRADPLERALINSRPLQRLRSVRQLGMTYLVYPGAEHSRFSHTLGAMHLAGRLYDALAAKGGDLLEPGEDAHDRRLVRLAALWHDAGHAPFSHVAEDRFENGIHHEEMSRRMLLLDETRKHFDRLGKGIQPEEVVRLLESPQGTVQRLLSQIIAGELDVDKMDYLLRDSLYCGVQYGTYDLDRLLDTVTPTLDPVTGEWGLGVIEGGVHALEALVMARYYMFTQVYFNVTGKAFELHFSKWLEAENILWPGDPREFLHHDDVSALTQMRNSDHPHARAVVERRRYGLAFETGEHLSADEKEVFSALIPEVREKFAPEQLLISNSTKDPHRLRQARVLVEQFDGKLVPVEEASHFIGHLARIERFRIYAPDAIREAVAEEFRGRWP